MVRSKCTPARDLATFMGRAFTTQKDLYRAACLARDGDDDAFEAGAAELVRLLKKAGELPGEATARVLRLRRIEGSGKAYHHLVADLSDGTTAERLSLREACRAAFRA